MDGAAVAGRNLRVRTTASTAVAARTDLGGTLGAIGVPFNMRILIDCLQGDTKYTLFDTLRSITPWFVVV